jgi:hypothetical protein
MLSPHAARCAEELRELLDTDVLAGSGHVRLGAAAGFPLAVAVRIALAEVDDLIQVEQHDDVVGCGRWHVVGDQIMVLHGLAPTRPRARSMRLS